MEEWGSFAKENPELVSYVAVSAGSGEEDFVRMQQIVALIDAKFICLDVANGYSEHVCRPSTAYCNIYSTLIAIEIITVKFIFIFIFSLLLTSDELAPHSLRLL